MGTQTGAPASATKGVGTGSTTKAISSAVWAAGLLAALQKAGYKAPVTKNNIDNILRVVGVESAGNQAGFLRDNNPWNLNTYVSPHGSLPGGHIVNEWGVNVQVFASVEQGYAAYVNQLKANPALLAALNNNAPPAMFGAALSQSGWSSGSYANATTFPTLKPFYGMSAVGGQGSFSTSAGVAALTKDAKAAYNFGVNSLPGVGAVHSLTKTVGATVSNITSVGGLIGKITSGQFLKNLGIFVAGGTLVLVGGLVFFSSTKEGHAAEATAAKVAA